MPGVIPGKEEHPMSEIIQVMQRVEMKYLLSRSQTDFLLRRLRGHMQLDQYGRTAIASLYYDTPDDRLIRASLEKPLFKEKLRLRSYGLAGRESPVFLELKRKACGVVYKRRMETTVARTEDFFLGRGELEGGQIGREIASFRAAYPGLRPACLIIYDREAYDEPEGDLRLTVDFAPRYRTDHLTLTHSMEGIPLRPAGEAILEIKAHGALPLWLAHTLDEGGIRKTSFSKYGEAYRLQHASAGVTRQRKETIACLIPSIHLPSPQTSFS